MQKDKKKTFPSNSPCPLTIRKTAGIKDFPWDITHTWKEAVHASNILICVPYLWRESTFCQNITAAAVKQDF